MEAEKFVTLIMLRFGTWLKILTIEEKSNYRTLEMQSLKFAITIA